MKEFYFQLSLTIIVAIVLILTKVPLVFAIPIMLINFYIDFKTYKIAKGFNNER